MRSKLKNLVVLHVCDKNAVTAIEYALIAALIAVVIIGAVSTLGGNISTTFSGIATSV